MEDISASRAFVYAMTTQIEVDDPMLRMPAVTRETGLSRRSIYRMIKTKDFPLPHQIGAQAVGWPRSVIRSWKASRAPTAVHA